MDFEPLEVPSVEQPAQQVPDAGIQFDPLPAAGPALADGPQGAFEQGYQAGVELASAQVNALASALSEAEASRVEQMRARAARLEAEAASLACQIASSLVDAELSLRPELILGVVQGAISDLPEAEEVVIELHPDDLALLEGSSQLPELKITFRPDPSLSPGGCRVRSSVGDVDATRETRLEQMRSRIEEISREQA